MYAEQNGMTIILLIVLSAPQKNESSALVHITIIGIVNIITKENAVTMKITLPIPLPTWNRLLAMHHWERKKCRDLIHQFVSISVIIDTDWSIPTGFLLKLPSMDLLKLEYLQTIRPSKSRKSALNKLKSQLKKKKKRK